MQDLHHLTSASGGISGNPGTSKSCGVSRLYTSPPKNPELFDPPELGAPTTAKRHDGLQKLVSGHLHVLRTEGDQDSGSLNL